MEDNRCNNLDVSERLDITISWSGFFGFLTVTTACCASSSSSSLRLLVALKSTKSMTASYYQLQLSTRTSQIPLNSQKYNGTMVIYWSNVNHTTLPMVSQWNT